MQRLPVSVVIPAFNREDGIRRAIESVQRQRPYAPAEVIVVDDASTDATADVAEALGVRVLRLERNVGAAGARNAAIAVATQPWIALLDSDDEWLPDHLATLWPLASEDVALVGGAALAIDGQGRFVRYWGSGRPRVQRLRSPGELYPENTIVNSAVLVRRDVVTAVGGYRTDLLNAEDLDLWLRVLDRGGGVLTPQPVTRYHVHEGQKSLDPRSRATQQRIIESYADRPWWSGELVHAQLTFRAWDAFRAELQAGRYRPAARELVTAVGHPHRVRALAAMLARRRRVRRRTAELHASLLPPAAQGRRSLLGVPFDALTEAAVGEHVLAELAAGRGGWICPVNVDVLRRIKGDRAIEALVARADLVVADGMPLLWAARLAGTPLPERVAGSSLIWSLTRRAAQAGRSVYLLGGAPGAADAAAARLRAEIPGLEIAGVHCPPFGFERDPAEQQRIRDALRAADPDVVFVGLGFPKQDQLVVALRDVLPGAWFVSCGVSFSFVAGEVRRAPVWVQRAGLEWLHRLGQEPRRLARRYLVDGPPFLVRLVAGALLERARRNIRRPGR